MREDFHPEPLLVDVVLGHVVVVVVRQEEVLDGEVVLLARL